MSNQKWCVRVATAATTALLALAAGCTNSLRTESEASRAVNDISAEVAVPPKQLVQDAKRILSSPPLELGVESEDKGTLVTGWKRYQGEWHVLHHWQERTRYRINVAPDWDDPTARARLSVFAETDQRSAEGQRWDREPRVPRPERARQVLQQIVNQLPQ